MEQSTGTFELAFKDGGITIQRYSISSHTIYRVVFSDKRQPLVITRAVTDNAAHWWTSIPEGRQKEAEEIGTLIGNLIQANQP